MQSSLSISGVLTTIKTFYDRECLSVIAPVQLLNNKCEDVLSLLWPCNTLAWFHSIDNETDQYKVCSCIANLTWFRYIFLYENLPNFWTNIFFSIAYLNFFFDMKFHKYWQKFVLCLKNGITLCKIFPISYHIITFVSYHMNL